jgi:hypothetical protein
MRNRALARELAKVIVAEMAPDELPMLDDVIDYQLDRVGKVATQRNPALGNGFAMFVESATTMATYIGMRALDVSVERSTETVGRRLLTGVKSLVGKRNKARHADIDQFAAQLSDEQLDAVAESTRAACRELGMSPQQSARVVAAVMTRLSAGHHIPSE